MRTRAALALLLAAALLAPAAARAQLGLDLGPADAPKPEEKKDAKKKDEKKDDKKPAAKPAPKPAAPAPAPAKPDAKKPEPARDDARKVPLPPPPVPAGSRADPRPKLEAAKKLLEQKGWEGAALAYDEVLRDPAMALGHDEARYQLAKALEQGGLHYGALVTLDDVLARGPTGSRFFHSALEQLFVIAPKLGSEQPILSRVARHAREGVPPAQQDRFWFYLAKYEFERGRALEEAGQASEARGAWQEARRLAAQVRPEPAPDAKKAPAPADEGGDVFARATFVDGLALYAMRDEQAATERFKEVIRLTNPRKVRQGDAELRELAFLQLARIHYQNRQNRYAIFYYGKMPWGGAQWLEGLWEASYAHYRIGEHEKALGNLLTLQSAYFKDEYFPESWVLKAIIYYENCRYPEARLVLEDFNKLYEPLFEELTALTSRPWNPAGFLTLKASPKALKLAYADQNIRRLAETAREVEAELTGKLGKRDEAFRGSPLGKALAARLAKEKDLLGNEAGQRARGRLESERDQLRTMLAQALRISIEVSRQEREALEGSLAAGRQVEVVKDLRWTHAVSDEHLYWPYEGEFWRDELGTYSYTLTKGCRDRAPRSSSAR